MVGAAAMRENDREFPYDRDDYLRVRKLLGDFAGIDMPEHKQNLIYSRLTNRLRKLGYHSFRDYLDRVEDDQVEFGHFINALTTNLTAFFREAHHFDFVAEKLLPRLRQRTPFELSGWSAGCSQGQEPYSIAMTLYPLLTPAERRSTTLVASDIDSNVLQIAANGVYPLGQVKDLDDDIKQRFMQKGTGSNSGQARMRRELTKWIDFRQINLMQPFNHDRLFDFIFCRNVMIYFDAPTQKRLLDRFADQLKPEGYLLVGHSESPYRLTDRFELIGKTIYQRVN